MNEKVQAVNKDNRNKTNSDDFVSMQYGKNVITDFVSGLGK